MGSTLAERFAAWLAPAMRNAGLDIDRQMGGGRAALADALDVSRSTVTRWLAGNSAPPPEMFEPLAAALNVPVLTMLVETGIIHPESVEQGTAARTSSYDLEQAAVQLGVPPGKRRAYVQLMKSMALLTGSSPLESALRETIDSHTRTASETPSADDPPAAE